MAEKMTAKEFNKRLEDILCPHSFYRKGSAFFRLHGDGVLQTIKREYEPHMGEHMLYFGLLSMYGEILPQWLTSAGCIPSYEAMLLVDPSYYDIKLGFEGWYVFPMHGKICAQRAALSSEEPFSKNRAEFQARYQIAQIEMARRMDPEVQLANFEEVVLPTLNQIDSQSKMYDMICRFSTSPNDSFKMAPLLACGRTEDALAVVRAILAQNRSAFDSKGLTEAERMTNKPYVQTMELEKMIQDGESAIQNYLQTNYAENNALFADRFLHKRRRKKA